MNSNAALAGAHLRTYRSIFQHPASHHLAWHDVHALFRQLAQVEVEPNHNLRVTRHGHVLVLPPPRSKDVATADELMALRHFLARSGAPPKANGKVARWLVVVDHREARIYRSATTGAVPQLIRSHVSEEFFCQTYNTRDFSRARGEAEASSFYEPLAGVLNGAGEILIFGSGMAGDTNPLTVWLRLHRPELAKRIVGSLAMAEHNLPEDQLLAKARDFYAHLDAG